jgi:hypothetical protein
MPNWLLLVGTISAEPRSGQTVFAGPIRAADTYEVTDRYQPADIAAARGFGFAPPAGPASA